MERLVVLGSGLAGYTLVREFRKLDWETDITLISRDSGDYYSKPMLSNALALGKNPAGLVLKTAEEMAGALNIRVLAGCEVHAIDRAENRLDTSAGVIGYDRLVLAQGADPIRIPLQGDAADEVLSVNDLADYARFRERLSGGASIAIMGAGLIGCEFANDLAAAGYRVSVIDPGPYPLAALLPEPAGRSLLKPFSGIGVTWRFGTAVQGVSSVGRGYELALTDETVMRADMVLSAVGLRPRIRLAQAAGLEVNRGIVVDERLQSPDKAIFALGDCAEIEGRVRPFVLPVMHAARTLAKILNGEEAQLVFPAMPVVVKTPSNPVVVSPPAHDVAGSWRTLESGEGVSMGFFDQQNRLRGFALTGEYAGGRNEMAKKLVL